MPLDLALTSCVVLSLLLAAVCCWVVGVVEAASWLCVTTDASVVVSGVCATVCDCFCCCCCMIPFKLSINCRNTEQRLTARKNNGSLFGLDGELQWLAMSGNKGWKTGELWPCVGLLLFTRLHLC